MYDEPTDSYGYCECGCGEKTSLAKQNEAKRGYVKGEPVRFVPGHAAKAMSERLFVEYMPQGAPDECWAWKGPRNANGYGAAGSRLAHRVAYERFVGPIPPGLFVCHRCDNPPCVNPAHLWLGTNQDNMDDMLAKGRANRFPPPVVKGRRNHARLNERIVAEIKARYAAGGISQAALGDEYGVVGNQIGNIVRGESWADVEAA